ncbi:MAG: hypothetical protein HKO72_09820 [Flavobacteriaceae bacterium]|nr:hypothetical protein [Bacteroidia bacterium]NNL61614.1 hypothetical protein [Flavobacteriaceae bacterium]
MRRFSLHIILVVFVLFTCQNDDDLTEDIGFQGEIEWAKTFGGSLEDFAHSVIQTSDGNILIFGNSKSIDGDITDKIIDGNDFWLLKMDLDGSIIWSKTIGGSGDDVGHKVIELTDGTIALAGYSMSNDGDATNNEGFHDNWLVKLDSNGNFLWEKSFGFAGHDHAYSIIQTLDGGFFMTGFLDVTASGGEGNDRSQTTRHGIGEFWCHKLDAQGNIEWRKYFGGSNNDRSYDAVQANDGGYVITGFSESDDFDISNANGSYDYWVIKLDSSGTLIWEKALGGSGIDQARSLVKTMDNGYIVTGNSFSDDGNIDSNLGGSDFWLVKLNDDGDIVWSRNYGGSGFDYATSINSARNGYIVTGYSQSSDGDLVANYGGNDFWILKINELGSLAWQKNLGGSGLDLAFDAIETQNDKLFIVGETESNDHDINLNRGIKDILVVKIK